jgi:dTDP-4-dehydrorhamnose reductase
LKILIFGKDGQVGRALGVRLPDAIALGRAEADFAKPETLGPIIARIRPDIIINAAAYTAVDAAEDDRDTAYAVNATAPGLIGQAARPIGALVVHYSTDYVFDGDVAGFHSEAETPNPRSVYGASKLAGEVALRDSGARHVILRTSWVYAPVGKNFILTILRLARERDNLTVVADQIGAPTSADLIADITAKIVARPQSGLYHLAPAGETSWHGLAHFAVVEAIAAGATLKCLPDAILPIPASQYPAKAARPANSRLDTGKLRAALGIDLPPWQEGVRQLIKTLQVEGRL